jgi:hypothetical protein
MQIHARFFPGKTHSYYQDVSFSFVYFASVKNKFLFLLSAHYFDYCWFNIIQVCDINEYFIRFQNKFAEIKY